METFLNPLRLTLPCPFQTVNDWEGDHLHKEVWASPPGGLLWQFQVQWAGLGTGLGAVPGKRGRPDLSIQTTAAFWGCLPVTSHDVRTVLLAHQWNHTQVKKPPGFFVCTSVRSSKRPFHDFLGTLSQPTSWSAQKTFFPTGNQSRWSESRSRSVTLVWRGVLTLMSRLWHW